MSFVYIILWFISHLCIMAEKKSQPLYVYLVLEFYVFLHSLLPNGVWLIFSWHFVQMQIIPMEGGSNHQGAYLSNSDDIHLQHNNSSRVLLLLR